MNKENITVDVSKRKNMKIVYPDNTISKGDGELSFSRSYDVYEDSAVIRELNKTSAFRYLLNSYKEVGKMIYKKFVKERNCL